MDRISSSAHKIDETLPLLENGDGAPKASFRRPRHSRATSAVSITSINVPKARDPDTIVAIACAVIFVLSGSGGFFTIPMTRILEDRFCREYYDSISSSPGPIDEELCKVDVVQSRLAYLFALNSFVGALLGCFVAMPWGLVADRLGRRPVFVLGLIGMTLETIWQIAVGWFGDALPIRLYCLGPLAIIIGGGNAVLNGTMCSLMSDVLPEADRAIGFMRVHIASMLGNLCSPMISSVMMPRVGPWPLLWLSVVLGTLPAAGILFVPETLTTKAAATEDHGDLRPDLQFSARLSRSLVELRDSLSMLKNLSVILLLFGSITLTPVILCTLQFLSQYVSKRYHVKLAYTGYVQGAYGGAHILFILFIIPYASKLVLRSNSPKWIRMANEQQRDLAFLKGSFVAVVLGTFVMSVSPSLPVFVCGLFVLALGSGAGSYIPSTLAFYIDKEHRTRMFSLVGIVQVMGSLYAEPMLAGLFTLGMRIGGIWIGLPYLGVAVLCGVAFLLLRFVRLPRECDRGNSEYHRTASDEIVP